MVVAVLAVSVLALWAPLAIGGVAEIHTEVRTDENQGTLDSQPEQLLLQGITARDARSRPGRPQTSFKGKPTSCVHRGKGKKGRCLQLNECYPYFRFPEREPWQYGIYDSCNDQREGVQNNGVCCVEEEDDNLIEPQFNAQFDDRDQIFLDGDLPGLLDRSHVEYRPPRPTQNMTRSPTIRGDAWQSQSGNIYPVHPTHPPLPTHPPSLTNQPWWNPTPGKAPGTVGVTTPTASPTWWTSKPTKSSTSRPTQSPWVTPAPPTISHQEPNACASSSFYHAPDQEKLDVWDSFYNMSGRVVGGFPSQAHSHPWLATLFNGAKQFCGGSLIDKTHILTAAHCIAHMSSHDVSRLRVRLGAHNIKTTEASAQDFKVKKVVRHKDYDARKLYNDVAILTLDRAAEFNSFVRPICLASGGSWVNDIATVAGWGSLYEGGPQPGALQQVKLLVWSLDKCRSYYGTAAPGGIVSSYICAGDGGNDSCMGDSGGPLVLKINNVWTQIGVVSWGIGCGKGHYPGVYSRLPTFLPWINRVKAIYR